MAEGSPWERTLIESVAELDVKVSHGDDLRIEHWKTVSSWLAMLAEEISGSGSSTALDDLLSGLPETAEGIRQNPFGAGIEPLVALLQGQSSISIAAWPSELKGESLARIASLREALEGRIETAAQPREALGKCVEGLRACGAGLREVSVLLATGKDREAMDSIVRFTDLLQTLLSLLPSLPRDGEREKLFVELNGILREVVAAFDARDSVLIGDLLEYEVTPRLEGILPLLSRYI
jgi:hypothetical protein